MQTTIFVKIIRFSSWSSSTEHFISDLLFFYLIHLPAGMSSVATMFADHKFANMAVKTEEDAAAVVQADLDLMTRW